MLTCQECNPAFEDRKPVKILYNQDHNNCNAYLGETMLLLYG